MTRISQTSITIPPTTIKLIVTLPDHRCLVTSISKTATIRDLKLLVSKQLSTGGHGGNDDDDLETFQDTTVISAGVRYTSLNQRIDEKMLEDGEYDLEGRLNVRLVAELDIRYLPSGKISISMLDRTEDGSAPLFINTPKPSSGIGGGKNTSKCKVCKKQLLSMCISCNKAFCINCAKKERDSQTAGFAETESGISNATSITQYLGDDEKGAGGSSTDLEIGNQKSFLMMQCNECVKGRADSPNRNLSPPGGVLGSGCKGIILAILCLLFVIIVAAVVARKSPMANMA
ncbi:UNVERIFIED_CONTAM: hypothetical protein HDU68_004080 [Siphonaria sp. JEL0065]|nr:hypothetical protein HDU68_004080 [Siphonaria sp. JEL0065]